MFTKDNCIYADAFCFLRHRAKPLAGLCIPLGGASPEDFIELPVDRPIRARISHGRIFWQNDLLMLVPPDLSYNAVKTAAVKLRYSNDDQMAIVLNRDKNAEKEAEFIRMQNWRDFAAELAKAVSQETSASTDTPQSGD